MTRRPTLFQAWRVKPALAVALALLCALASAPTAQAAFGSPFDVSAAGGATLQQVALDAQGGAHFVWKRSSVSGEPPGALIETRMRASDGTLGAPQRLSREMENPGHELLRPRVAIGGDDRAHFAWSQEFGDAFLVQARVRAPDGALGPVQDISEPGHFAGFPELAVDAAGRTTFVWIGVDPADPNRELVVKSRRRAADGALGPIQAVSGTGTSPSNAPDNVHVAVDPAGNAHFAWEQGEVIETARRSADGVLGPVRDVSVAEPGQVAGFPRVAVAPDGDVDFVWSGGLIRTRRLAADGTFGPVRGVSAPSADGSEHADVAVDPDGNAHIVWEDPVSPPPSQMIRTRRVAADGTLGPIQDLSATSSGEVSGPSLAVDGAGNAHFAWSVGRPISSSRPAAAPPAARSSPYSSCDPWLRAGDRGQRGGRRGGGLGGGPPDRSQVRARGRLQPGRRERGDRRRAVGRGRAAQRAVRVRGGRRLGRRPGASSADSTAPKRPPSCRACRRAISPA